MIQECSFLYGIGCFTCSYSVHTPTPESNTSNTKHTNIAKYIMYSTLTIANKYWINEDTNNFRRLMKIWINLLPLTMKHNKCNGMVMCDDLVVGHLKLVGFALENRFEDNLSVLFICFAVVFGTNQPIYRYKYRLSNSIVLWSIADEWKYCTKITCTIMNNTATNLCTLTAFIGLFFSFFFIFLLFLIVFHRLNQTKCQTIFVNAYEITRNLSESNSKSVHCIVMANE